MACPKIKSKIKAKLEKQTANVLYSGGVLRHFPYSPSYGMVWVIFIYDFAVSFRGVLIIFNSFRSFYFVVIVFETIYNSLDIKELLRDIVEASLCELFNHVYNDLIVYLKDKLKNLGIPEDTEPGAGDVEEGYLEELAEAKDTNASVLGAEELDNEVDAFDGDQGKLGGIEEADGHPGSPADAVVSTFVKE